MAVARKTVGGVLGTSSTTVYTCPTGTSATVTSLRATNVSASDRTYELTLAGRALAKGTAIAAGQSHVLIEDGPMFLVAGDTIVGLASAATSIDVALAVIEMS